MRKSVTIDPHLVEPRRRGPVLALLGELLDDFPVQEVLFPEDSVPPPPDATVPDRPRMFIMVDGCRHVRMALDGSEQEVPLRRGQAMFAGRTVWHKSMDRRPYTLLLVIFDPLYTGAFLRKRGARPQRGNATSVQYYTDHPLSTPARHLIAALSELARFPERRGADVHLLRALLHFVRLEFEARRKRPGKARATWQALCDYLRENFQRPINRDEVAHAFGLHPNHVSRLFHEQGKEGFTDYLTRLRMEHAGFLRQHYRLPLKELAAGCGFDDANYFGRVFRRHYGTTPGRYALS
ncbi:MAG: helix-turn-helix transcriptional regulator [Kiritimatiellae bacterium]|nr:helix-turn-helix transcriptional regulator [Kiritimatiellia bacterium]